MVLHGVLLSPYMARLWLLLRLKGRLDAVHFAGIPGDRLGGADHKAVNPLGRIPYAVLEDGSALPESQVIAQYLERLYPDPPLIPSDPASAAQVDLICRLLDLYVLPEMIMLTRMLGQPDMREQGHMEAARTGLGHLEHFCNPGAYAVGDSPSLADCALWPLLFFVEMVRRAAEVDLLDGLPKLATYRETHREMETVTAMMQEKQASLKAVRAARKALEEQA